LRTVLICIPKTAAISPARRPSSVSRIARARSASPRCSDFDRARKAACSAASAVSVDFPGMLGLHSPHPRQTIQSIAYSQAVCLAVLIQIIENDPQNLTTISDYVAQKYPSAREGVNVSSRPISGREVYFSPSVFELPAQSVDQTLVAVMMPFAAEYRNIYETIQRACAFHKLNCQRVDDIWEHAILI
jgi:hypothetical protein